ncbi:glutaminyl-peptide cyclotransferase [Geoalkalibacter sp.]|uniref:glutaminyl-peptide cyclotransferase n=1 Tax=Geoalkalibacter sp. TaxID=3041440 RepID=UPI00272E2D24|nr:glutaminyl-peptide cyclotransferase [Geoalkalibacter sp.]
MKLLRGAEILSVLLLTLFAGWSPPALGGQHAAPVYQARVVAAYPHDSQAFTQGLLYHEGYFYESTGKHGASSLRRVAPLTGQVLARLSLPDAYFGEGLTLWEGRLVQLTWKNRVGLVYSLDDFSLVETFALAGEGWGLTHDGTSLILSDGSAELSFLDPRSYQVLRRLAVHDAGRPVRRLNELEYIRGEIWANVWLTDRIAIISPEDGRVRAWLDLTGLLPAELRTARTAELNGIAYDAKTNRIFVTGKYWPRVFEIEIDPGKKQEIDKLQKR